MDRPKPIDRNDPDFVLKNKIAMQLNFFRYSGKSFNDTVEHIFQNSEEYFKKKATTKADIPDELMHSFKNKVDVLMEAMEKDENFDQQIAFKMLVGTGHDNPHPGGSFQVIAELIVKEEYFLKDGHITIVTDPPHEREPYKTLAPEDCICDETELDFNLNCPIHGNKNNS